MRRSLSFPVAALILGMGLTSPAAHAAFDLQQCINLAQRQHTARLRNDCPRLGGPGKAARTACEYAADMELGWELSLCYGSSWPGALARSAGSLF